MKNNIEKLKQKIMDDMKSVLEKSFVGKTKTSDTIKKIKQKTSEILLKFSARVSSIDLCETLWKTWTLKQKFVWFIKIKLKTGMAETERYERMYIKFRQDLAKRERDENIIDMLKKDFERAYKKYWYELSPKSIVVVGYSFTPVTPAEYLEFEVKNEN